jgi:hypothetical protein
MTHAGAQKSIKLFAKDVAAPVATDRPRHRGLTSLIDTINTIMAGMAMRPQAVAPRNTALSS